METDLTRLTFLTNPMQYQAQPEEVCIHIPPGISSAETLTDLLQDSLGLPPYGRANWYALRDKLSYWDNWSTTPRRVVLIHTDVPFLHARRLWWLYLQGYLHALIDSIAMLQRKNEIETNPLRQRELVAIFPTQAYEEIQAVFTRPPDWQLALGFYDYDAFNLHQIDPSWSLVLQYLTTLNGLTAEVCTLSRKDMGRMSVQYLKDKHAYCVKYQSPDQEVDMVASQEEDPSFLPVVSLSLATHILETFFTSGQRSASLSWSVLSPQAYRERETLLARSYYWSDEEALIEYGINATRRSIGEGIQEAIGGREDVFSLEYWRDMLSQPDATLTRRLAAICLIGRSPLSEKRTLLRPLLHSPVKQERWISARFFGQWQDEEARPILLEMLTDELPVADRKAETEHGGYWYDSWRIYAPRLLRSWQTSEVREHLRKALALWIKSEPQFDQDLDFWRDFEERICYELGYREDFTALANLSLEEEHRQELLLQMKRGYKVKRENMTTQEEYKYITHKYGYGL